MTPEAVSKALEIMSDYGIAHDEAMQVLALVAVELHKSARITKAAARNMSVVESEGYDAGKAAAQAFNARLRRR